MHVSVKHMAIPITDTFYYVSAHALPETSAVRSVREEDLQKLSLVNFYGDDFIYIYILW